MLSRVLLYYYTPSPRGGLSYGLMAEPTDDSRGSPPHGISSGMESLEVAGSASGHGGFDLHTDAEDDDLNRSETSGESGFRLGKIWEILALNHLLRSISRARSQQLFRLMSKLERTDRHKLRIKVQFRSKMVWWTGNPKGGHSIRNLVPCPTSQLLRSGRTLRVLTLNVALFLAEAEGSCPGRRPLITTLSRVSHARTDVIICEVQPCFGHDPGVATPGYSTWCGRVYYTPSPRGGLPYGLMAEPTNDNGGSPPRGIPSGAGSLEVVGSASGHGGFDLHTDAEGTGPGGTRHATGGC
ncbi:hypothetical protein R1flu_025003 [Riccia fluitans]|uniref:Uncharacterized protein n=1 Tax=Riccia fluitans TaxID=41844 RepID=A0ABD1XWJ3_9MARC